MTAKGTKRTKEAKEPKKQTPTFLLELPLVVDPAQAKRLRAHLEAGRQFYNALLSQGQRRLQQMRADPAWQAARAIPRSQKQARQTAFSALREQYGFSEYGLHEAARRLRTAWIAEHLDAVLAQTLATRAYRASTGSVWERPNGCASRVGAEDFPASRISATIPDCALSCTNLKRAIKACSSGKRTRCAPSSMGMTRSSPTA